MSGRVLPLVTLVAGLAVGAGLVLVPGWGGEDRSTSRSEAAVEEARRLRARLAEKERRLDELRARVARAGSGRRDPGEERAGPSGAEAADDPSRTAVARALNRLQDLDPARFGHLSIERLRHAHELDLSRLPLGAADLEALAALPDLSRLNLANSGLGDAELAALAALGALETLELGGTFVTDAGLSHLQGLGRLERLGLRGTSITDGGLETLGEIGTLQALQLDGTSVTDAGLLHLQGLSLTSLSIGQTAVGDTGLGYLRGFRLRELGLHRNTSVTDTGMAHLAGQTDLESINLRGMKITAKGLEHLSAMKKLRTLNASLVMDDAAVGKLEGLTGLRELHLYSNPRVTDAGAVRLQGLHGLTSLSLQNTGIGDASLDVFAGLPSLRFLDVRGTNVSRLRASAFRTAHPRCRVIR